MTQSANVEYIRAELAEELDRYNFIRTILGGHYSVKKAKHDTSVGGLPKINPLDTSDENEQRNADYLARALFYNFTTRTARGLIGAIFLRDAVIELPEELKPLLDNVDGEGQTLSQLLKKVCNHVLPYGRGGLFTDFEPNEGTVTREQVLKGDKSATINFYEPWNIINWRESSDRHKQLQLVVLRETYDDEVSDFESKVRFQYRVLRMIKGKCHVQIWRPDGEAKSPETGTKKTYKKGKTHIIKGSDGQPIDFIPFEWIGADNNDSVIDYPPMYDLAVLNHGHYLNSADHEESVFICGQPTPVLSGLTQDWVDNNFKDQQLYLGSRDPILLGENADADLMQADPNTLAFEAMKHKEDQAQRIGAKLIQERRVEKTATEAEIDSGSENSVLADVVQNVQKAMIRSLKHAAGFVNAKLTTKEKTEEGETEKETIVIELNDNFDLTGLIPEEIRFIIELVKENLLTIEEARVILRRSGMATEEYEVYLEQIAKDRELKDELTPKLEKEAAEAKKQNPGNQQQGNNNAPTK